MRVTIALVALLAGCGTPDPDPPAPGDPEFVLHVPPADAPDVPPSTDITVEWTAPVDGVDVTVIDGGVLVEGTLSRVQDGAVWAWQPTEELEDLERYDVVIDWDGSPGPIEFVFTTGVLGAEWPAGDLGPWPTGSWVINYSTMLLLDGLDAKVPDARFLVLDLSDASDLLNGTAFLRTATATLDAAGAVTFDACDPVTEHGLGEDALLGTADDTPAAFDWPDLTADLGAVGEDDQPFLEVTLEARVTRTEDLHAFRIAGLMDTRPLDVEEGEPPGTLCALLEETVGITCLACPGEAGAASCMPFDNADRPFARSDFALPTPDDCFTR